MFSVMCKVFQNVILCGLRTGVTLEKVGKLFCYQALVIVVLMDVIYLFVSWIDCAILTLTRWTSHFNVLRHREQYTECGLCVIYLLIYCSLLLTP